MLVGYETFAGRMCELANGSVVTPGSLVPWLDEAWVERVVFDGPDRIKNVGVRRRIFTGATRRAVEVRDRECFHPLCDATVEDCEVDHVEPWPSAASPSTTTAAWPAPSTTASATNPDPRPRHERTEFCRNGRNTHWSPSRSLPQVE